MLKMMRWGLGVLGLAVAGVVAVSALGVGSGAMAQTPPEDDPPPFDDRYRQYLAEELGISVDELTEAQTAARDRLIDEMLAEGKINEEQAERLKAHDFGEGRPLGFWLGFGARGTLHQAVLDVFETAADIFGLEVQELRDRIAGGESLSDIAESQGMDEATLKSELVAALTEEINQAVEDGDINEQLADRLLEHVDELVDRAIDRDGPFHGEQDKGLRTPWFGSRIN